MRHLTVLLCLLYPSYLSAIEVPIDAAAEHWTWTDSDGSVLVEALYLDSPGKVDEDEPLHSLFVKTRTSRLVLAAYYAPHPPTFSLRIEDVDTKWSAELVQALEVEGYIGLHESDSLITLLNSSDIGAEVSFETSEGLFLQDSGPVTDLPQEVVAVRLESMERGELPPTAPDAATSDAVRALRRCIALGQDQAFWSPWSGVLHASEAYLDAMEPARHTARDVIGKRQEPDDERSIRVSQRRLSADDAEAYLRRHFR